MTDASPHPLSTALADHQLAWHLTDNIHNWRCQALRREALAASGIGWADPDHPKIVAAMIDLGGHHEPEWAAAQLAAAAERTLTATQRFLRRLHSATRTTGRSHDRAPRQSTNPDQEGR